MKRNIYYLITVFLVICMTSTVLPVQATGPTPGDIQVLSSDTRGVTFEVFVPWQSLSQETVTYASQTFTKVTIPGWDAISQPGEPELPLLIEAIGVPFGVTLSVSVKAGKAHSFKLENPVLPAATQTAVFEPSDMLEDFPESPSLIFSREANALVYETQQTYPGIPAEVVNDGVLRQQRVAGVAVYPVQYDPQSNTITIYKSLLVTITFEGVLDIERMATVEDTDAFEDIYQYALLNYEGARQWRHPGGDTLTTDQVDSGSRGTPVTEISAWDPPDPGWRINVSEAGLYQLTYTELLAAGVLDGSPDPRNFQMYQNGEPIAIKVAGEGDGTFNTSDVIIFYGQAISSKYTQENVYWLTIVESPGSRMGTRTGLPGSAETPDSYVASRTFEGNRYYFAMHPGDDAVERFMWNYIYAPSRPSWTHTFDLITPTSGQAQLSLTLVGYLANSIDPDHHVLVNLNGTQIGDEWFDGVTINTMEFDITGLLVPGSNTLQVTCPNDTGVGYDIVYIDGFTIEFVNTFTAEDQMLQFDFETAGDWLFQVENFSDKDVAVFDISDPNLVEEIVDIETNPSETGYTLLFEDLVDSPTRYMATANSALLTVIGIEKDISAHLQEITGDIEHIVITHETFTEAAESLVAFRSGQGMNVLLVEIQDIYDEFGFGVVGIQAIKDFLAFTYAQWGTSYVLLVGDGHYDPKNYMGFDRVSFIPPYLAMADPWIGETAADNRYVTLAGSDNMPDMMIGRLSVNTADEAAAFVNKVIAYEQNQGYADWKYEVLAVADDADTGGNFPQLSDNLINDMLPKAFLAEKVHFKTTHTTVTETRQAIQAAINSGKLLINYIGHGAYTSWAYESLLKVEDVPALTNGIKLPVILSMTCYDGFFLKPEPLTEDKEALAEVITRADGKGAVASWSPTGLGLATGHDYLNRGFFDAYFYQGLKTLGEATLAGKFRLWLTGGNLDLLDTYVLFGDPALNIARSIKAVDDEYQALEDILLSVNAEDGLLANDLNPDELVLSVEVVDEALHGDLQMMVDGAFTYSPDPGWSGVDTFSYRFYNGEEYSIIATVQIFVLVPYQLYIPLVSR